MTSLWHKVRDYLRGAPKNCDYEIYTRGEAVFVTHSIEVWRLEKWVRKIRKVSGQPVDWHFVGGRAVIKALGDVEKVRSAIANTRRMHDAAYLATNAEMRRKLNMPVQMPGYFV